MRGVFREAVIAKRAKREQFEQSTSFGYQAVKCWVLTQNKKKMPSFESLLPSTNEPQSVGQMKTAMAVLAAQYGGRLIKVRRSKKR